MVASMLVTTTTKGFRSSQTTDLITIMCLYFTVSEVTTYVNYTLVVQHYNRCVLMIIVLVVIVFGYNIVARLPLRVIYCSYHLVHYIIL